MNIEELIKRLSFLSHDWARDAAQALREQRAEIERLTIALRQLKCAESTLVRDHVRKALNEQA